MHLDPDNFRHSTCTKQHYYINRAPPFIPVHVLASIQSNSLITSRQSILKYGNWRHNSLQILDIIAYYLFTFNHHFLYIFSDLKFLSLCKRERERKIGIAFPCTHRDFVISVFADHCAGCFWTTIFITSVPIRSCKIEIHSTEACLRN